MSEIEFDDTQDNDIDEYEEYFGTDEDEFDFPDTPDTKAMTTQKQHAIQSAPIKIDSSTSMLQAIGQMAMNTDVDMDKVERLMKIQEHLANKEKLAEFNRILAEAQSKIPAIQKTKKNEHTHSSYADLGSIIAQTAPVYTSLGMSISFKEDKSDYDDHIKIIARVSAGGHIEEYEYNSPVSDKGIGGKVNMTRQHARASAVTYAKRYLQCMILNIPTEDDDGNAGGGNVIEYITEDQSADLEALIEEVGAKRPAFVNGVLKIQSGDLLDLPAAKLKGAIKLLEQKRRQQ